MNVLSIKIAADLKTALNYASIFLTVSISFKPNHCVYVDTTKKRFFNVFYFLGVFSRKFVKN